MWDNACTALHNGKSFNIGRLLEEKFNISSKNLIWNLKNIKRKKPVTKATGSHLYKMRVKNRQIYGEGYGNPLQYSHPDKRSLAGYSPWHHKESDTTEQPTHTHTHGQKVNEWWSGAGGLERLGLSASGYGISFWDNKNILEISDSDAYINLWIY